MAIHLAYTCNKHISGTSYQTTNHVVVTENFNYFLIRTSTSPNQSEHMGNAPYLLMVAYLVSLPSGIEPGGGSDNYHNHTGIPHEPQHHPSTVRDAAKIRFSETSC